MELVVISGLFDNGQLLLYLLYFFVFLSFSMVRFFLFNNDKGNVIIIKKTKMLFISC